MGTARRTKTYRCRVCDKENLSRDEIGITRKMFGRRQEEMFCIDCIADFFNVERQDILDKIEEAKAGGCTLFG